MTEVITFKEIAIDGKIFLYPSCVKSCLFAELLKIETFNLWHLGIIEKIGFECKIVTLNLKQN